MEKSSQDDRRAGNSSKARHDLIKYVEELAGPGDAWITVVDAARITGSSESMANRWVTSGRLPIRGYTEMQQGELVGVPPRTRQCRLSDVARIRPILYPEQAISPIVRTLNLPSIPKEVGRLTLEHQQIAADHRQLMQRLTELQEAIDTSREQFQREMHQQGENHLNQARLVESYRRQGQQALEELVADYKKTLLEYQRTVDEVLRQAEQAAQQRLTTLDRRLTTEIAGLAGQIAALDERFSAAATNFGVYTEVVAEQLSSFQQRYEAMNRTIAEQGTKLAQYASVLIYRLPAHSDALGVTMRW
jgi:hypothetical protein